MPPSPSRSCRRYGPSLSGIRSSEAIAPPEYGAQANIPITIACPQVNWGGLARSVLRKRVLGPVGLAGGYAVGRAGGTPGSGRGARRREPGPLGAESVAATTEIDPCWVAFRESGRR